MQKIGNRESAISVFMELGAMLRLALPCVYKLLDASRLASVEGELGRRARGAAKS